MAAFMAGWLALIVGLLFGFMAGMFYVGYMISESKTFCNYVQSICGRAETEYHDDDI